MTDYNPNIPQSSDNLSTSQAQILNNFGKLDSIFDVNHVKYSDATTANQGKHRKIDFPATTTVISPTGTACVIYPKNVSGVSAAYFENVVGGSVLWRGGSTDGLVSQVTGTGLSNGSLTLPNGIKFIWGAYTGAISSVTTVTFADGGFANNCFSVMINPTSLSPGSVPHMYLQSGQTNNTQFKVVVSGSFNAIYYFAVGN